MPLLNWARTNKLLRLIKMEYQRWSLNPKPLQVLSNYLVNDDIETVVDAGANIGQFASELRFFGYKNRIISLEPSKSVFKTLNIRAKKDKYVSWAAYNIGISDKTESIVLNISGNFGLSSSILKMKKIHEENFPSSKYIDSEEIQVFSLDAIIEKYKILPNKSVLKLDLQGLEWRVLSSHPVIISNFAYIYFESSIKSLYEDEQTFSKLVTLLDSYDHDIIEIFRGLNDFNGNLLQIDVLTKSRRLIHDFEIH